MGYGYGLWVRVWVTVWVRVWVRVKGEEAPFTPEEPGRPPSAFCCALMALSFARRRTWVRVRVRVRVRARVRDKVRVRIRAGGSG